jgi:hypothetical protein
MVAVKYENTMAGKMQNPRLWQRLSRFGFDAGEGSEPYSVKLAAAEGWPAEYTARVIEEYRRFLYLTQVDEGQATPSVAVDRAWHMHLTFTRSYWDVLCGEVLQKMLHHDPCRGAEEMDRYADQYGATKRLYAEEFGQLPPEDIWPGGEAVAAGVAQNGALAFGCLLIGAVSILLSAFWLGEGRFAPAIAGFAVAIASISAGLLLMPKRFGKSWKASGSGGCGAGGAGCGNGGCGGGGCGGD